MCWLMGRGVEGLLVMWRAIPLCLMWLIWKEYDRRAFEDVERPLMELKLFFRALHEWITVLPNHSSSILLAFIDSCSFS